MSKNVNFVYTFVAIKPFHSDILYTILDNSLGYV